MAVARAEAAEHVEAPARAVATQAESAGAIGLEVVVANPCQAEPVDAAAVIARPFQGALAAVVAANANPFQAEPGDATAAVTAWRDAAEELKLRQTESAAIPAVADLPVAAPADVQAAARHFAAAGSDAMRLHATAAPYRLRPCGPPPRARGVHA